jgi:MATE family multidrug resistance protein
MSSQDPELQAQGREGEPLLKPKNFEEDNVESSESVSQDAHDTLLLGIPIFLAMLSWVGMKTTDSALLGHVSAEALAAAALSDLWTMCTAVLLQGRILSVLCGSAVGAGNPKLAGIYLQVSYYVLAHLVIFVFIAWFMTEQVWLWLGSDPHTSQMAGYYSRMLAWSLPAQMLFGQLQQFFSSQRIMHPEVTASSVALILNLVFGLLFVLGIPIPGLGYGFTACPIVTTAVTYVQLFILYYVYIHIQRLHEPCWGGWNYKEITWQRIRIFCDLYIPAALGTASDFWRVGVVGLMAAKLGEEVVAVFNTSYRIMWIVLILVSALSSAASIKMTQRLGKMDHKGAQQAGEVGVVMSAAILGVIAFLVYWKIRWFGRIFTNEESFLELFESARLPFTLTLVLMNLSVAIERIPMSMGRTKEVFWLGFVASWGFQVPAVYLCTTYWRDDLVGLYWGMTIGYFALALLYGVIVFTSDWRRYAELSRERSEMSIDE